MKIQRKPFRPPPVPESDRAVIVRRITAARESAGLSQTALALAAGLSRAAVSLIESGRSDPTLGTLYAIAGPLGVHPADLLREAGNKSRKSG